jgi:hypothetical protein
VRRGVGARFHEWARASCASPRAHYISAAHSPLAYTVRGEIILRNRCTHVCCMPTPSCMDRRYDCTPAPTKGGIMRTLSAAHHHTMHARVV